MFRKKLISYILFTSFISSYIKPLTVLESKRRYRVKFEHVRTELELADQCKAV